MTMKQFTLKDSSIRIGDEYRNSHGEHFIVKEFNTLWGFTKFHPQEVFDNYNNCLCVIGKYGHDENKLFKAYIVLDRFELYSKGQGKEMSIYGKDNSHGFISAYKGIEAVVEPRKVVCEEIVPEQVKSVPDEVEKHKDDDYGEQLSLF